MAAILEHTVHESVGNAFVHEFAEFGYPRGGSRSRNTVAQQQCYWQ